MSSSSLRLTNLVILLLGLGNARCGGTASGDQVRNDAGHAEAAARVACNPLAPPAITLGTVLGVGEGPAPATTIYVVDERPDAGPYNLRVFASSGKTLYRKYIDGSGTAGPTEYSLTFDDSVTEPSSDFRDILLEVEGGAATRMALAPSTARTGFAPDAGDMSLTLLDGGSIRGFAIKNLPNVIDYVADAENGDSVILVSAMDQESMADEHVFYGKPSQMVEAPLLSDNRDCCEVLLSFTVNGAMVEANFVLSQGGAFTTSSLQTAAGTFGLKVRNPTPTKLDGFSFTCAGI